MSRLVGDSRQSTESCVVCVEDHSVSTRVLHTNTVVGERARGVEVEDPQQSSPLEDDDFVALILQADVCLWGVQPSVLVLSPLHCLVEVVEEVVAEELVFHKVELAARVVEAVVVAFTGEVEPFWVAKLVAFEVEVGFSSQTVGDETNHLVKCHAALNDRCEGGHGRHVGVHFSIAEPE